MTGEAGPEGDKESTAGFDEPGDRVGGAAGERVRRFGPPRAELWCFVELFAVTGLLVAQPLFDFLGRNQRALMVLRLKLSDTVLFALLVLILPPLALWAFEALIGLVLPAYRKLVHVGLLSVLLGLAAAAILKVSTHLGAAPCIVTFAGVACVAAWALLQWSGVRQWLHLLAIAPLLFTLLFVAASPTSELYFQHPKVASVKVERPARVVMIVFDEFPDRSLLENGHVDRGLFPNFAALADDATWYRNESSVALYTGRAVPAILTGRMPPTKPTPSLAERYPQSLFTLLGGTYDMHAREKYEQLCPTSLCDEPQDGNAVGDLVRLGGKVLHNLLDVDRSSWDHKRGFRWGVDRLLGKEPATVATDFVAALQPSKGPRLDYVHVLLPHAPWRYLDDFRDRGRDTRLLRKLHNSGDRRLVALGRQLHLLQVQATDWFVGQVIDRLKAIDEYDDSLVVVTADHGVAFPYARAGSRKRYPDLLWTPLFVKAPGQTDGRVDDRPMLSVDVLPTIADILGVDIPWKVDGISALQPERDDDRRPFVTGDVERTGGKRSFPGATGFQRVVHSIAAPAGGDPALRLYRIGPFGALVGREAQPLARPATTWLRGKRASPARWHNVDPDAGPMPWAIAHGFVYRVPPGQTIAVAVNGHIAGLALLDRKHEYYAPLAPQFFVTGTNAVTPYLVRGTASEPWLIPIPDGRAGRKSAD